MLCIFPIYVCLEECCGGKKHKEEEKFIRRSTTMRPRGSSAKTSHIEIITESSKDFDDSASENIKTPRLDNS